MALDFKKITSFISDQFPDHVRSDFDNFGGQKDSKFVEFVKSYYEWLEQDDKAYGRITKLKSFRDIDDTLDEFVRYFKSEFLQGIPSDILADKRLLVKHIREVYQSKGTQNSYRFLFRILYDMDIDFYIPGDHIIRLDDGIYDKQVSLRTIPKTVTVPITNSHLRLIANNKVIGATSLATAGIEQVAQYQIGPVPVTELLIDTDGITGTFVEGETLTAVYSNNYPVIVPNGTANITAQLEPVLINAAPLLTGSQQLPGDKIAITAASRGHAGALEISTVTRGPITSLVVNTGGSGYVSGERIRFINDYFDMYESNGSFTVGETVSGSVTGATAVVRSWDELNKKLWFDQEVGTFRTFENSRGAETIMGGTSLVNAKAKAHNTTLGGGADGRIVSVNATGAIETVTLQAGGIDYITPPAAYPDSPGTGATFSVYGSNIGSIATIKVSSAGFGSGRGFGIGYYDTPIATVDAHTAIFGKKISYFENDEVDDEINNSNGASALRMIEAVSGTTFADISIRDLETWASYVHATFTANTGLVCNHAGKFLNTRGTPSSDMCIYDGYYYQQYSYVVKVEKELDKWKEIVKAFIHPAGTKMFCEMPILTRSNVNAATILSNTLVAIT